MSSVNKVILVGNVGNDPIIRSTQNGKEIANFSLATADSWKDKNTGEKRENTEWHNICIFNHGLVGVVKQYVKKGSKLYIEGQLKTEKYIDKNGVEKYTTKIVLTAYKGSLTMLGDRKAPAVDQGGTNVVRHANYDPAATDPNHQPF